jgi:hypothetical protein
MNAASSSGRRLLSRAISALLRWILVMPMILPTSTRASGGGGEVGTEAGSGGELRVRVVAAGTGEPLACAVALRDARGRLVAAEEGYATGFRAGGGFTHRLPAGPARMRITRGPEYRAAEREIEIGAGAVHEVEVTLERKVDLRSRGWFGGDSHTHMIHGERTVPVDFDGVALAARSEDLQYLSLGHAWQLEDPTPERLEAELGRRSTADCVLTWGLEAPKNYFQGDAGRCLGHCWTLGMNGRTSEGADVIPMLQAASAFDYEVRKPSYANFESQALIRVQGGAVFYTHPARWWTGAWGGKGGYPKLASMRVSNMAVELPYDLLAGPTFDGVDVITTGREVESNEKAFRLWSLLLDHGYRVAATGSSDSCFDRPGAALPGVARVYTHLDTPFSIPAVTRATAAGRTFVTTGPLLVVSVDDQPPGSAHPADGRSRVLRLETWSSGAATGGLARVEILRGGQPFREFRLEGNPEAWRTNLALSETRTTWYCVRVFGSDARSQRAVSGAFFFDERPWTPPDPVPAVVRVRVVDAETDRLLEASVTEVAYLGTWPRPGRRHALGGGVGVLTVPATVRLRAESAGYESSTLSPFFDHPPLVEAVTRLEDRDLLDWGTYERMRSLMGDVALTFRLRARPVP